MVRKYNCPFIRNCLSGKIHLCTTLHEVNSMWEESDSESQVAVISVIQIFRSFMLQPGLCIHSNLPDDSAFQRLQTQHSDLFTFLCICPLVSDTE